MPSISIGLIGSGSDNALYNLMSSIRVVGLSAQAVVLDEPYGWKLQRDKISLPIIETGSDFSTRFLALLADSEYFIAARDYVTFVDPNTVPRINECIEIFKAVPACASFIIANFRDDVENVTTVSENISVYAKARATDLTQSCEGYVTLFRSELLREILKTYSCFSYGQLLAYVNDKKVIQEDYVVVAYTGTLVAPQTIEFRTLPLAKSLPPSSATPKYTVIISSFNRDGIVTRAIESVYRQTENDFEIIVVNDGGKTLGSVLSGYDRRLKLFELRENSGPGFARTVALRRARGTYVCFLDDDDWLLPHHLQTLGDVLDSGADAAYGIAMRCYVLEGVQTLKREIPYQFEFDRMRLQNGNYLPILTMMFRRQFIDKIGFFDSSLVRVEDWDFWRRLSLATDFVYVPVVTSEFRWDRQGRTMTSSTFAKFIWSEVLVKLRVIGMTKRDSKFGEQLSKAVVLACEVLTRSNHSVAFTKMVFGTSDRAEIFERFAQLEAWAPACREAMAALKEKLVVTSNAPLKVIGGISVVIPLFNAVSFTEKLLRNLYPIAKAQHLEVILVDNASTDRTSSVLRELPREILKIRNEANRGFAEACNQGARFASNQHVVFLNNDTLLEDTSLATLVQTLQDDCSIGIAGNMQVQPELGLIHHVGVAFSNTKTPLHILEDTDLSDERVKVSRDVEAVTGACLAVRRAEFLSYGGFDEGYRNGFEDVDLCLEYRSRGKRVRYNAESCIQHFVSRSPGRLSNDIDNFTRFLARREDQVVPNVESVLRELEPVAEKQRCTPTHGARVAFALGDDCGGMSVIRLVQVVRDYARLKHTTENPFLILTSEPIANGKGWPWYVTTVSRETFTSCVNAWNISHLIAIGNAWIPETLPPSVTQIKNVDIARMLAAIDLGELTVTKEQAANIFSMPHTVISWVKQDLLEPQFVEVLKSGKGSPLVLHTKRGALPNPTLEYLKRNWLIGECIAVQAADFIEYSSVDEFEVQVIRALIDDKSKARDSREFVEFLAQVFEQKSVGGRAKPSDLLF